MEMTVYFNDLPKLLRSSDHIVRKAAPLATANNTNKAGIIRRIRRS